jgi:hypothetical protein
MSKKEIFEIIAKTLEDLELEMSDCFYLLRLAVSTLRNMEHCEPKIIIIDHLLYQIECEKNITN